MEQFTYTIQDPDGLHARPAGMLAKFALSCTSSVSIKKDGKNLDAKRLFSVMSLGVKKGDSITFQIEGENDKADCAKLKSFCERNI
nr:HPr family phosphocarrier protein [uncultured Caproiciproducens sp.]